MARTVQVREPRARGYSPAARRAWQQHLQRKYKTVDKLNKQWGSTHARFAAVEPPSDIFPAPPTRLPDPTVPLLVEFLRFRMETHNAYFRESVAALRRGDPNHAILPQFIAHTGPRVSAADDLLGLSLVGWDLFSTHDWPGNDTMQPLAAAIQERIPTQPIRCDTSDVELLLRRAADDATYVWAVNLGYGAPVTTRVDVAGRFTNVVDLSVGEGVRVPVRSAAGTTQIPLFLGPGDAALVRLAR